MICVYLLHRRLPGQAVGTTVRPPSDGHGKGQWIPATVLSALCGQIRRPSRPDRRGWEGERHWRAIKGQLEVQASHHGARVLIAVTVRRPDMTFANDAWEAHIVLTLGPGEQLDRVARDLVSALASDSHTPLGTAAAGDAVVAYATYQGRGAVTLYENG